MDFKIVLWFPLARTLFEQDPNRFDIDYIEIRKMSFMDAPLVLGL